MKNYLLIICFMSFLNIGNTQCDYPNDVPVTPFHATGQERNSPPVKVKAYAVRDDNGVLGFESSEVENFMNAVVDTFMNYNIELSICIQEVHNTSFYNSKQSLDICFNYQDHISIAFYDHGSGGSGGVNSLVLASPTASSPAVSTAIHELGHALGLKHTFNNENNRDSVYVNDTTYTYCLIDPTNCAETIGQKNCLTHSSDPLTCEITGDGICDTPAHIRQINGFTTDRCGIDADPLINDNYMNRNFMSYGSNGSRIEFTPGQKEYMQQHIIDFLGFAHGTWMTCPQITITKETFGIFDGGDYFYADEVVEFPSGIKTLSSTNFHFDNCTVLMAKKIELTGESTFTFSNNTVIKAGSSTLCGLPSEKWTGIELYDESKLIGWYSEIMDVDITTSRAINARECNQCTIRLDGVDIIGENDYSVQSRNSDLLIARGNLDGAISASSGNTQIWSTVVNETNDNVFTGISLSGDVKTLRNVEVSGFTRALNSNGGALNIWKGNLQSDPSNRSSITNTIPLKITHSYFDNGVLFQTIDAFEISRNSFECSPQSTEDIFYISNQLSNNFVIENNIFKGVNNGIHKVRHQAGLKFLCNDFSDNTGSNFTLVRDINPLQGYGINTSSGNIFNSSSIDIDGMWTTMPITYNFNAETQGEEPFQITHNNLTKLAVVDPATCLVGPHWSPDPEPIDPTGPVSPVPMPCNIGIDCFSPCPPGINCLQDCPPGINCLVSCPSGIDCTSPCPNGINCFEPCPPGINCLEDCPPGVDCTNPCPPGLNCEEPCLSENCINLQNPDFIPNFIPSTEDDILPFEENAYQNLMLAIFESQSVQDSFQMALDVLLNETPPNINNISSLVSSANNIRLKFDLGEKLIQNSKKISEANLVYLIQQNLELLYHPLISQIVFDCDNLSNSNIALIQKSLSTNKSIIDYPSLWEYDGFLTQKNKIISFVLSRLNFYRSADINLQNIWLKRLSSITSNLRIADNLLKQNKISQMNSFLDLLIQNPNYTDREINDILAYKEINILLSQVYARGGFVHQMTPSEINQLVTHASGSFRYSSQKAYNILVSELEYSISEPTIIDDCLAIDFLRPKIRSSQNEVLEKIKIFPNPTNENITVQYPGNKMKIILRLSDILGNIVFEKSFISEEATYSLSDLPLGVYSYALWSTDETIRDSGKIILAK